MYYNFWGICQQSQRKIVHYQVQDLVKKDPRGKEKFLSVLLALIQSCLGTCDVSMFPMQYS